MSEFALAVSAIAVFGLVILWGPLVHFVSDLAASAEPDDGEGCE